MKIALFSDIHCNYPVFSEAVKQAKKQGATVFISLGDAISDGFDNTKIINRIREEQWISINGNRELSLLEYHHHPIENWQKYNQLKPLYYAYQSLDVASLKFLSRLPIYRIIEIEGKRICLSHGTPYSVKSKKGELNETLFSKLIEDFHCDMYFFGHTHRSFHVKFNGCDFINVGSIGLPVDHKSFTYGILTIDDGIKYEQKYIDIPYEVLEEYYTNSDFYTYCPTWCRLNLMLMRDKINHPFRFLEFAYQKAEDMGIDCKVALPNDFYETCFLEYREWIGEK